MKRKTRPVTSREYKVMLNAARFDGSQQSVLKAAERFRRDLADAIFKLGIKLKGEVFEPGKQKKQAWVQFLDTKERSLRNADWIFRLRRPLKGGKVELTLKRRHPDRIIVSSSKTGGEPKFEEDIKVTNAMEFISLYSLSAKKRVDAGKKFRTIADIQRRFKPLAGQLDEKETQKLRVVGGLTARQTVLEGPQFAIGQAVVECGMIIWHDKGANGKKPVVVEFSFRYKDDDLGALQEPFSGRLARDCFRILQIFRSTKSPLGKWADLKGPTKTSYAYSLGHSESGVRLSAIERC